MPFGHVNTLEPYGGYLMRRFWSRSIVAAFAVALAAPFAASPAGAIPANSGCKTTTVPGAVITQYPATPGSMSAFGAACTFDNRPASNMVSPSYTIHDFETATWHTGAARKVTAVSFSGSTLTVTGATCNDLQTWTNRPITGPGISPRTFVKTVGAASPNCLLTLNAPVPGPISAIAKSYSIDNATSRSVDDATVSGSQFTSAEANCNNTAGPIGDQGKSVSGTYIAAGTTVVSCTTGSPNVFTLNQATLAPGGAAQVITIGGDYISSTTRRITDGDMVSNAGKVKSLSAIFTSDDIGLTITCAATTGFPTNAVITAINGIGTVATINPVQTNNALVNRKCVVGENSATAPIDGASVLDQSVQIDLSPGLVAGSNDCALNDPEGFAVAGSWRNPATVIEGGLTLDQPAGSLAIGEILIDTSAADWAGWVVIRGPLYPGDPNGNAHYDIVWPYVPTGIGMCPGNTNSPGIGWSVYVPGTTVSVAALPSGTGKPGTAQLRNTVNFAIPSNSYGRVTSDTATTFLPTSEFERLCIVSADAINFQCGTG